MAKDELDGPLFRIKTSMKTQRKDRATGEWIDTHVGPETEWTVSKQGPVIDLQIGQPMLDVANLSLATILHRILQYVKQHFR